MWPWTKRRDLNAVPKPDLEQLNKSLAIRQQRMDDFKATNAPILVTANDAYNAYRDNPYADKEYANATPLWKINREHDLFTAKFNENSINARNRTNLSKQRDALVSDLTNIKKEIAAAQLGSH